MYLSDKRAINLFGLSPGPALRRGKAPNLLVYRRYGCRGFRGTSYFSACRHPAGRRKSEGAGESRPIRSTDGGNSRFLGRYIPRICRDSYEFPTDPAILSRPHRPIPSNRGERVAVGKSIMCGGYFTLVVEMEILCSCSFSSFWRRGSFFSFDRVLSPSGRI